jgi:hypothetical protein
VTNFANPATLFWNFDNPTNSEFQINLCSHPSRSTHLTLTCLLPSKFVSFIACLGICCDICVAVQSKLEGVHEEQMNLSISLNEINQAIEEYCSMMVILMSSLISCVTSVVLGFAMMVSLLTCRKMTN